MTTRRKSPCQLVTRYSGVLGEEILGLARRQSFPLSVSGNCAGEIGLGTSAAVTRVHRKPDPLYV